MSTTTTTALVEPVAMSHRRQPARQARTNPARNASSGRTLWTGPEAEQPTSDEPPAFFPGLTHFTDSITALPKEMVRQFTMLKEVDAKITRPEDTLTKLTRELLAMPLPRRPHPRTYPVKVSTVVGRAAEVAESSPTDEEYDPQRRELALQLRIVLNNMVPTMDEKTHVLTAATDTLQALLKRCESSWPQIEKEISEETRLGNPNHRALDTEAVPEKKPSAVGERPRREAAMSNAHAALAEERDQVRGGSRKNRGQQVDSDFDEARPTKSKARSRKTEQGNAGLGINGAGPNKRRKVEKVAGAKSQAMDRAATSRQGHQVGTASPSQTPHTETVKKRARGNAMAGAVGGRKRAGTANSTHNSPAMASSPVMGSFSVATRGGGQSPAMGAAMQRSGSTRARQNSTQHTSAARNASITREDRTEVTAVPNGTSEPTSHPKTGEVKAVKTEDAGPAPSRASAGAAASTKKEAADGKHRPPSISTSTTRNNGRASKGGTPTAGTFPDTVRPRSGRAINPPNSFGSDPPKRSHKKGAGLAAQQKAAEQLKQQAAQQQDEGASTNAEEDDEGDEEPTYCYCARVSYGEMVACDGPNCPREWFHLGCVGLQKAPKGNEKWFCRDCQPRAQRIR